MASGQIVYIRRVANDTEPPNRIRELREALGLSQQELARMANCDPTALNKVEKGTRGLDQKWMRRLAPHLNVTPAELLPLEDNPYQLSDEEREMIDRLRSADDRGRQTFRGVADAVLPFRHRDDAA